MREPSDGRSAERGAGLLSASVGVLVLLVLILLATQVMYVLYARSVVTAAAYDAARIAAGANAQSIPPESRIGAADAHLRRLLGRFGRERTSTEWSETIDEVELTVNARTPSLVPAPLRRAIGIDTIRRTVRVRTERVR